MIKDGWVIYAVELPYGVLFHVAFKDGTMRLRRFGWLPIQVKSDEGGVIRIKEDINLVPVKEATPNDKQSITNLMFGGGW